MFNFEYFNNLGLNLYTSSHVKNVFNSNEANMLKCPNINWEKYKNIKQEPNDISFLKEQQSCGFGIILGFNNIYSLDIDGYLDETIIYNLLYILELPSDYEWVIKSGSGIGFHIIFSCSNLKEYEDRTIAYFARYENRDFAKLEFKFQGHSILPHSLHETGNYYSFYHKIPKHGPKEVQFENLKIIELHYCSFQTAMSEYDCDEDGVHSMKIDFVAPNDNDPDFIFKRTLRENKSLIITSDAKKISNTLLSDKPLYLIQMSLLMLDLNYNIVFRKNFSYVDNLDIFNLENDIISTEVANTVISGTKNETLNQISNYIELVDNVIVFNKEFITKLTSEIETLESNRNSNLHYIQRNEFRYSNRKQELFSFSENEDVELDYIFKKKFNRRINLNSALLKAYALYFLFLDREDISCESKKITPNELWEIKVVHDLIQGENETFFKKNLKIIQSYLTRNYHYKNGSIRDFIETNEFYVNGNYDNWFSAIEYIVEEEKPKTYNNFEPDYDQAYDRREIDRDNFDALSDGQYGDFDNFSGDFDSLRDSMGY